MPSQDAAVSLLISEFCNAFHSVFEQTSGTAYPLTVADTAELKRDSTSDAFAMVLTFSGAISGLLQVTVDHNSVAILAARFLGTELEGEIKYLPEHDDAVMEIVNQTAGVIADSLRTRFGGADVATELKKHASSDALVVVLKAQNESNSVQLRVSLEQDLVHSTAGVLADSAQRNSRFANPAAAEAGATQRADSLAQDGVEQQNLQMIMDVELDLTLRFGQRSLALSEIADLTSGSVIELDREVDEPVELLLGDRVIARGEVVIVDGNYGLRITEMASVDRTSLLSA